ncbi:MAG: DUF192 domain-containing protein [Gemmatimonadales bacterium]|nr:MAG: DUF192 domain-containing protein [Gemmatimonadales bacterium]
MLPGAIKPFHPGPRPPMRVVFPRPALLALLVLLVPLTACGNGPDDDPGPVEGAAELRDRPARGMAWVIIGPDTVLAEVADTPELREEGLMFRTELPDGEGMFFIFEQEETLSFWMRNTFIPLDIAFLDETMEIVDIQALEPEDEEMTESNAPARFALEVRQGWFQEQGIEVGDQVRIVFGR